MNVYARLWPYIKPHRLRFAQASVAMLGVAVFNGGSLYLLKPIVDHVFVSRDFTMLWLVIVGIPVLVGLKTVFSYMQNYLMSWIGQRAIQELREDLFRHLHGLSLDYFAERDSGEILSRVTNDLNTLQSTLNSVPLYLIRDSLTVLILSFVLFWVDWRFTVLALLSLPAIGITLVVLGRKMRQSSLQSQVLMARIYRRFQESLSGMAVIQAYNYEEGAIEKFRDENLLFFNEMMRYLRATALTAPLMELAASLVVALLLYYGATEVIDNHMTPGAFFAFMGSFFAAYAPAKNIARLNSELQRGLASGERIFQLLDEKPRILANPGARPFKSLETEIEFSGVSFQYPGADRPALRNVGLKIRRGERVAVVGPSGAGKSTLVHLLVRLYEPSRGAILYDGLPLPELDARSVRERIALITREPLILNDSVLQNVTMGRTVVTLSQVEEACKAACASEFIAALPQGFLTKLGDRTVRLTRGQRQRLAVARALLKDACLIVLDGAGEPDETAGDETGRALKRAMEGRTVLLLTDRVAAAAEADTIFVLKAGEIVEAGTHPHLLRQGGFYRRLHDLQVGAAGNEEAGVTGS
ncbi:MAG: ABC transporter ATP-binding protein [Elusimicrobia bacterium]|nr:ABC transporter ATP-binding protein [Elusimicrobiota bacterium]